MAKRINISVPDELAREIGNWGGLLNISQVCQRAISREIESLKAEKQDRRKFLARIREEIRRRQKILVDLANGIGVKDGERFMDETDRLHIRSYLEREEIPQRPEDPRQLMKVYGSSCLSNHIIRRQMIRMIGRIPTPETIPVCLDMVFDCPGFREDDYWMPANLAALMTQVQKRKGISEKDLSTLQFKPRIIAVLIDGAHLLDGKTRNGLEGFYREISDAVETGPDATWRFVKEMAKPVRHVGHALICDFLKNIGFSDFVRVEGHFKEEFPELMNEKQMTEKKQFLVSLELCRELGIRPFLFDHIMYQWGRYKRFAPADEGGGRIPDVRRWQ